MKWLRNTKAFTLIEVMIVISIIAILAAIMIPNFIQYMDREKQTVTEQTQSKPQKTVGDY